MDIDLQVQVSNHAKPTDVMNIMLQILLANEMHIWKLVEPILNGRTNNGNAKMDGLEAINIILEGEEESTSSTVIGTMLMAGNITKNDLNNKLAVVLRKLNIKVVNGHISGLLTADEVD